MSTDFDVIVVGSGITGGWAAKELTEAGLKVLMIERGRMIEHGADYDTEFKAPWEMPFRGRGDQKLYEEEYYIQRLNGHFDEFTQNHFVNDEESPYAFPEGKPFHWFRSYQLGGRSLTWGRHSYRWSDYDFGANARDGFGTDWPIRYADIAPWYDKVEAFIGVSGQAENYRSLPDGSFLPPMEMNVVEQHLKSAVETQWPDRCVTIGRVANVTQFHNGRGPCQYRNICARGCSFGAYFSTQSATLPAAEATGNLTVLTDMIVESLDYDAQTNRVTGINAVNRIDKSRKSFTARLVFLNAGSFNSVHLMLRSRSEAFPNGIANSSGVLGTHIMDHASTLAVAATVPGFNDKTTYGNRPNSIIIPRFINLDEDDAPDFSRGYSFQGGALQSTWSRGRRMPGIGKDYRNEIESIGGWRIALTAFAESLPRATNRLQLHPTRTDQYGMPLLDIHFEHGENEHKALANAHEQARAMVEAAGGNVLFGLTQPNPGGSAIHEMGGARMGNDPATSVLNKWSQSHDIPNLFVTDGAQMASSACQNPSLTYMALTARAADAAAGMLKEGKI